MWVLLIRFLLLDFLQRKSPFLAISDMGCAAQQSGMIAGSVTRSPAMTNEVISQDRRQAR
jgi:hypothetical protein